MSLEKSFLYRTQAIFLGRLSLIGLYFLLWILSNIDHDFLFANSLLDLSLITSAFIYTMLTYHYRAHQTLGRWLHFLSLILDNALHLWLTQKSGYLFSPLMAIHPFLTAAFLLLFHNPLLMAVPLAILPIATYLSFLTKPHIEITAALSLLLLFGVLDVLAIFFIHLAHSKEQKLLHSILTLKGKLTELALIKERQRISQEFHDGVGAKLTSIAMQCDYINLKNNPLRQELVEIKNSALESIDDMRRSIACLRGEFDIEEQIDTMLLNFKLRHKMDVVCQDLKLLASLSPAHQIIVCRIIEEALTNILKHAQASTIFLLVEKSNGTLKLIISDDGVGFDDSLQKVHHFGLKNIKNRAREMNAHVAIRTVPDQGTTISLEIP